MISSTTGTSNTPNSSSSTTKSATGAGSNSANSPNEFLSLLTAQLTQQDPLEPMSNQEMMNQIVSIQTMEGLENLRVSIDSLSRQRNVRAADLLGSTVELSYEDQNIVGPVDSVKFSGDTAQVVVNGKPYPESAIVSVRQS